ncbi:hypothetical protein GCM10011396_38790 [Undibacterium terreum]|uniref:Uncharacterized protein n=1 Tax=Undibacterium terreum TaxID=1224302 RepID=A0A916UTR5_9BURK|nr:hypothetical protein GCM10011396_38790 [Undibacterium terreum]
MTLSISSDVIGAAPMTSCAFGVKSDEFVHDYIMSGDKVLVDTAGRSGQRNPIIGS